MNEDQKIDQLLSARPIDSRDTFVDETMARIRSVGEQITSSPVATDASSQGNTTRFEPRRLITALSLLGAAAAVAAAFFVWSGRNHPVHPSGPAMVQEFGRTPHPDRAPASSETTAESLRIEEEQDLLAAEQALEPVEFLLEGDSLEFLYLLSADINP